MCRLIAIFYLILCVANVFDSKVYFFKINSIYEFVNLQILPKKLRNLKFSGIEIEIKVCYIFKNDCRTILRNENFMYRISYVCLIKNRDVMKNSKVWQKFEFSNRFHP